MRDELLDYYERELTFLRQMGRSSQRSTQDRRAPANRAGPLRRPHVERMIEAFAFLAGRVHLKIDDEFPRSPRRCWDSLPH